MKTTRLMLTSVLALTLLVGAACTSNEDSSGSAIGEDPGAGQTDPGKTDPGAGSGASDPGASAGGGTGNSAGGGGSTQPEPAQGGDGPATVTDAIAEHKDTERINFQVIEDTCGDSQGCLDGLAKLQDYLTNCADCSPVLANFNNTVSNSQLSSGSLPTTLPQVKDITPILDSALNGDASAEAGADGSAVNTVVEGVVDELNKMGYEETDWTGIVNMVDSDARADFESEVKDALSSLASNDTAKSLLAGEKVPASDAATAIDEAISSMP